MSGAKEAEFTSMRVMINKEKTKVLFAMVDRDLADVLLSFLTLPLGTIVRLLNKHYGDNEGSPVIGNLNSLYGGLMNLDVGHFWTEVGKDMLLNPRNSHDEACEKLKLNIDDTRPISFFSCEVKNCKYKTSSLRIYHDSARCRCGKSVNSEIMCETDCVVILGFTKEEMCFLISDNLGIFPNVKMSLLQCFNNLGITETEGVEERTVVIGTNEIMDLLKGSLLSPTPLTDLILNKQTTHLSKPFVLLPTVNTSDAVCSSPRKMVVNAIIQRSTNKFLFIQAKEDFVDFLFSLLTIPLGQVERLLGNETILGSVDNLYRSISNAEYEACPITEDAKNSLINPKIPPRYLSKNQIFPLTEDSFDLILDDSNNVVCSKDINYPKGEGSYVNEKTSFMITDDLTVTPSCLFSSLSILNELKIHITDVEERQIHIGLEEGLNVLRASLTTTTPLSQGLNINLKKR